MANHQHRAQVGKSEERCFFGPVAQRQNQAAHGNITRIDHCSCGATRATNVNQQHIERGPWIDPR